MYTNFIFQEKYLVGNFTDFGDKWRSFSLVLRVAWIS